MSSYALNNYAEVFKNVIETFQPRRCVELGVLDGYSTIAIGKTLKAIGGRLDAWDLFEDYPYRHSYYAEVKKKISDEGLDEIVVLHQADAMRAHEVYEDKGVDLLHVDLSNIGETLARIMKDWDPKLVQGGMILFEGGSEERDRVEWMEKYGKSPIKAELEKNEIVKEKYIFGTYLKFPSLTCLLKKRD